MRSPGEKIIRLIKETVDELNKIEQAILDDVTLDKKTTSLLPRIEKLIVNIRNMSIYRDSLLGSSNLELAKKYNLKSGKIWYIIKNIHISQANSERT
jgi:hypothetical protein